VRVWLENGYSRPEGQSLLGATYFRSRDFKASCNDLSLRKTGNCFMAISTSREKLGYCKKRPVYAVVYAVAKNDKITIKRQTLSHCDVTDDIIVVWRKRYNQISFGKL